jgi:hypothetical protein
LPDQPISGGNLSATRKRSLLSVWLTEGLCLWSMMLT